jgi:mono/diheme cytochrome c family protein
MRGWWPLVLAIGCTGPKADDGGPTAETGGDADTDADTDSDTDTDTGVPTTGTSAERVAGILALAGDAANGEAVYLASCRVCHGVDGTGAPSGPPLTERLPPLSDEEIVTTILAGKAGMTPFASLLENQEVADVHLYITDSFQ